MPKCALEASLNAPPRSSGGGGLSAPSENLVHQYDFLAANVVKDGGNLIATVTDLVGAQNLTQGTAANKPLWVDAQINGLPIARFDGVTDLITSAAFTAIDDFTVAFVAKMSSGTNKDIWHGRSTSNPPNIGPDASNNWRFQMSTDIIGTAANTLFHYFVGVCNQTGSSQSLRLDGASLGTAADATTDPIEQITLGGRSTSTRMANCDVAELLIYNAALSGASLTALESYLASKYSL